LQGLAALGKPGAESGHQRTLDAFQSAIDEGDDLLIEEGLVPSESEAGSKGCKTIAKLKDGQAGLQLE
jgi:hypothetical protein